VKFPQELLKAGKRQPVGLSTSAPPVPRQGAGE